MSTPPFSSERTLWQALAIGLRNVFALIGVVSMIAVIFFYYQGERALNRFDPQLRHAALDFIKHALHSDVAAALTLKIPLEAGVSVEDAIKSMELRANHLNLSLVGRYPIHTAIAGRTWHTEVMEFCNADIAYKIIRQHPAYLTHMPCRIGIYEDDSGKAWLVTANLNLLIHGSTGMFPELKMQALAIQDTLLQVMAAGAMGDLDDPR
jgi:uncharacterized protein (DUF302 family)